MAEMATRLLLGTQKQALGSRFGVGRLGFRLEQALNPKPWGLGFRGLVEPVVQAFRAEGSLVWLALAFGFKSGVQDLGVSQK